MFALNLTGVVVGGATGAVVALVLFVIVRWGVRRSGSVVFDLLARKTKLPLIVLLIVLGAWGGFLLAMPEIPDIFEDHVSHALLILIIAAGGWSVYAGVGILGDNRLLSDVTTGRDVRRFKTQVQILRRVAQAVVVILTLLFILLTFPQARAPVASVLASAGLLSVVAGLAAQTTLGNMFAGMQLAFTDALRVGDNVLVPGEDQPGRVEEVTLTYVVVRIWDERRLILPSSDFTTKSFENWTRRSAAQLLAFTIQVDWRAPVAEIRAEVERLLAHTDLWDGRTWSVQVADLTGPYMTLRIVVSGENWARLQDLRAYIRENVVDWIRKNAPWAIPREFITVTEGKTMNAQLATDAVDHSLLMDPTFTGPLGGGRLTKEQLFKPDPDAEVLRAAPAAQGTPGAGLFHGTAENEERAKIYDGPGKQTLWRRTLRVIQRDAAEAGLPVHGKFDDEVVARANQLKVAEAAQGATGTVPQQDAGAAPRRDAGTAPPRNPDTVPQPVDNHGQSGEGGGSVENNS